jgi:hypothetical protein
MSTRYLRLTDLIFDTADAKWPNDMPYGKSNVGFLSTVELLLRGRATPLRARQIITGSNE